MIDHLSPNLARPATQAYSDSIKTVWAMAGLVCVLTIVCATGIQEKDMGSQKRAAGLSSDSVEE